MSHALIGEIAGIIHLIAFVPYFIGILRGRTKPHRGSWFVWAALSFTLLASYRAAGGEEAIWSPVAMFAGSAAIFLLSLRYGVGGWDNPLDRYCLIGALSGIAALFIFQTPLYALAISMLTDLFAAIPTARKAVYDPDSEDVTAWGLAFLASVINLWAIDDWSFSISGYPVYAAIVFALICIPLFRYHILRLVHRHR
jgi:hypothetical protein